MEVYILDDLLRRETVIDRFESLIWTERYSAFGDFQLVIHSTFENRSLLTKGTQLAINNSLRVMTIENVENKDDSEGRSLLTVTGRSLESALEDRAVRKDLTGLEEEPRFILDEDTPANALRALFKYICVDGELNPADVIPFYIPGNLYPTNTISEPDETVIISFEPTNVYQAIKEVCEVYGLGFRLYRGLDDSHLYFNIYTGDDRTSTQTTKPAVIFSPDLDNLTNVSEFSSIEQYKNVALVVTKFGSGWVYIDEASEFATGFNRRVLVVNAGNIEEPPGPDLDNLIQRIGQDELSKYKPLNAIDGELPINSRYRYGIDYELGDLIEMRNDDGITNRMRVTEQIFVDDAEGERSYPTLTVDLFIEAGTWYAWDYQGVWDTAEGTWDEA